MRAHRLTRFYGKAKPSLNDNNLREINKATSLELLSNVTSSLIYFMDRYQSIRPYDITNLYL